MTLPTSITLPLDPNLIKSDNDDDLVKYMSKLIYVISTVIQQTNQAVNGVISLINTDTNPDYSYILGSTSAGTATYNNPILWVKRANLETIIWFDIEWTGHTGTGNLLVQLPYYSQPSDLQPYVGVIEPDSMTFTASYTYLTANLLPNTNTIEIHQCGSGQPVLALPISAAGHLRGSIIYAGQQFR